MLKRKQVIAIVSIVVLSSLIGTSMSIASNGNPWDKVWEAIYQLETEVESLNQTILSLNQTIEDLKAQIRRKEPIPEPSPHSTWFLHNAPIKTTIIQPVTPFIPTRGWIKILATDNVIEGYYEHIIRQPQTLYYANVTEMPRLLWFYPDPRVLFIEYEMTNVAFNSTEVWRDGVIDCRYIDAYYKYPGTPEEEGNPIAWELNLEAEYNFEALSFLIHVYFLYNSSIYLESFDPVSLNWVSLWNYTFVPYDNVVGIGRYWFIKLENLGLYSRLRLTLSPETSESLIVTYTYEVQILTSKP